MSDTPARIPTMEELRATIHAIPGMRVQERGDDGIPSKSAINPTTRFFLTPYDAIIPKSGRFLASKNSAGKQVIKELMTLVERITPQLQNGTAGFIVDEYPWYCSAYEDIHFPLWCNGQHIGTRTTYEKERIELAPELGGRRYTVRRPIVKPIIRRAYIVLLPDMHITQQAMGTPPRSDGTYHFKMSVSRYQEHIRRVLNQLNYRRGI